MKNELESSSTYLFWGEVCLVLGRIFGFVVIRDGVNAALFLSFLFVPGPVTTAVPDNPSS